MADRRRRRRQSDGESDEEQTEAGTVPENKPRISECESESEHHDADVDLSEYESANEDKGEDKGETEVTKKKEEKEEEEEEESEEEEDSEEEDSEEDDDDDDDEAETYDGDDVTVEDDFDSCSFVDEERQSGDGEEQPEQDGDLDDDEDKKNPAYIPRKGAFYEHDMRIAAEIEESNKPKKKLWKDDNKWLHDCYREDQQAPKSREELVAMYGYDIRQYDKPPDAPPRSNRPRVRRTEDRPKFSDFLPERSERVRSSPQKDFVSNRNERSVNSPHRDFTHERDSYSPRYQQQQQQQSYRHDRDDNDYYPPRYNSQRDQGYDNDRSSRYSSQSDFVERKNNYNNAKSRGDRDRFTRYRGGDSNRRGRGGRGSDNRRRNNYSDGNDSGRGPRKFPPRFQRQHSPKQFNNYNNDGYEYDTQGNIPNMSSSSEQTVDHQNLPAPDSFNLKQDEFPTFSPSGDRNVDNNDDINKENVNIVIQSSGDRKSYSKERKSKLTGRTRVQDFVANAVEQGISNLRLEDSGEQGDRQGGHIDDKPKSQSESSRKKYNSQVNSASQIQKQDLSQQGKPKRYSSQRQRNVPDAVSYQDSVPVEGAANYYNPALAKGYNPPNPVTTSRYQQKTAEPQPKTPTTPTFPPPPQARPMLQAPIAFPLPVSAAGITSPPRGMPNPQRLPNPPQVFQPTAAAVSLSTAVPMVAPQYINNGVLYGTTPAPYQVPPGHIPPPAPVPIQGFPSPPDVTAAPPPQRPSQPPFRSGTTYYSPELQYQGKHRSPVRRPKAAIPIVNPQDIKKKDLVDKEGDTSEGLESEIYHDAEMESTANLINIEESETVLEHESNINVQSDLSPCQTDSDTQKQADHPPVKEQISAVDSPVPSPPPPPDSGEVASIPVKEIVEAAT